MSREHHYSANIRWTGNKGPGTIDYKAYDRDYILSGDNKEDLHCSADSVFRGDPTKYNPEDTLIASISACHMLWYLHFCADAGVIVTEYSDQATGTLVMDDKGLGRFTEVTLNPLVRVSDASMITKAEELQEKAREYCFIANSVNFPVGHKATVVV